MSKQLYHFLIRGALFQQKLTHWLSSLAWAELYLVLAALYARFDFALHETLLEDIEMGSDEFTAVPKSRNGVRVTIRRANVS